MSLMVSVERALAEALDMSTTSARLDELRLAAFDSSSTIAPQILRAIARHPNLPIERYGWFFKYGYEAELRENVAFSLNLLALGKLPEDVARRLGSILRDELFSFADSQPTRRLMPRLRRWLGGLRLHDKDSLKLNEESAGKLEAIYRTIRTRRQEGASWRNTSIAQLYNDSRYSDPSLRLDEYHRLAIELAPLGAPWNPWLDLIYPGTRPAVVAT